MTGFSSLCSHHHPSIHLLRGNYNNKNNNNNASTSKRRNVVVITGQKIDPKWGDGRQWGKNKLGKKLEHRSRLILEYEVAREFVWTLGLYDEDDWRDWAKDRRRGCVFIPRDPWNAYRNRGWIDMDDWLGRPLPFAEAKALAREFAKERRIRTQAEWWAAVDSRTTPSRVPVRPGMYYRDDGWIDYDDWLGVGLDDAKEEEEEEEEEER